MSDYEKCVDVYQVTVRSHEGDVKETRLVEEAAWVDFDAKPPKDHKYASRFQGPTPGSLAVRTKPV